MTAVVSADSLISVGKTGVLLVDDSAVVRSVLRQRLASESSIEVIGTVSDWTGAPIGAAEPRPDLIVLDIEMPSLRGPGRARAVIEAAKSAVIVLASPTGGGAAAAVEALAAGAVDAIAKPVSSAMLDGFGAELIRKIHAARAPLPLRIVSTDNLLAIAGSSGGVKPLVEMLAKLPGDAPATLVVQQMPVGFSTALARYLAARCAVAVREARDGDAVQPGQVLLAPAGKHMLLRRAGAARFVEIKDGPAGHPERVFLRSITAGVV